MTAYHELETRFRRIGTVQASDLGAPLGRRCDDAEGGAAARADQLATLRRSLTSS